MSTQEEALYSGRSLACQQRRLEGGRLQPSTVHRNGRLALYGQLAPHAGSAPFRGLAGDSEKCGQSSLLDIRLGLGLA